MTTTKLSETIKQLTGTSTIVGNGSLISSLNYDNISSTTKPSFSSYFTSSGKVYYTYYATNCGRANSCLNNVAKGSYNTPTKIFDCVNLYCTGEISGSLTTIPDYSRDYLGIDGDTVINNNVGKFTGTANAYYTRIIYRMNNTYTGFHRCFIEDNLLEDKTIENVISFKNTYTGRVVISIGKIATHKCNIINGDTKWEIQYDKNGITIQDAVPIVQLSRIKKDKRVFGVFGLANRNNTHYERSIVNSIGEGAIWVVNTNGNIINGSYLQSSNELGYAEKQDDDMLHNYTVGKSTIDCNFELNSDKYETIILENGVLASFIACTYHCG